MLYHLTTPDEWSRAQAEGQVAPASLAREGFVHASEWEQLPRTLQRWFAGVDEVLLLAFDPAGLDVRWEPVRDERFPHVYGPIPLGAVRGATPLRRGPQGSFLLPPRGEVASPA